jgi:hypothetical protein
MAVIPQTLIKKAHKDLCDLTKHPLSLHWAGVDSDILGRSDEKGITLFVKAIKTVASEIDPEHLPHIDLKDKQAMLWLEVLTHEAAHQLLEGNSAIPEKDLVKLLKYTPATLRRFIVQNTTVMDGLEDIEYMAGIREDPKLKDKLVLVDTSVCDKATLFCAHEFAAHLASQKLMAQLGELWKTGKDPVLKRIGAQRCAAFKGVERCLTAQGLQGLNALDFLNKFNKQVQPLEHAI